MQYLTLDSCTIPQIVDVFNASFADYIVKVNMTRDALLEKMRSENVRLDLSVGCLVDDELVGFILHGYDILEGTPTVYNAATGVVPEHRGKRITQAMYQFIGPTLKEQHIAACTLEVIASNEKAIKAYNRLGYRIRRTLSCYKGRPTLHDHDYTINTIDHTHFISPTVFWDTLPSWGHDTRSINRALDAHKIITITDESIVLGYAIYTLTGRVKQLAVQRQLRRRGIGSALLKHIANDCSGIELSIFNVDETCTTANAFLKHADIDFLLNQYEMAKSDVEF